MWVAATACHCCSMMSCIVCLRDYYHSHGYSFDEDLHSSLPQPRALTDLPGLLSAAKGLRQGTESANHWPLRALGDRASAHPVAVKFSRSIIIVVRNPS